MRKIEAPNWLARAAESVGLATTIKQPENRLWTSGQAAFADPEHLFAGTDFPTYNPSQLVTKRGLHVFDAMRMDDQVKAAMQFKKLAVLAPGWEIQGPEEEGDDWIVKRFVEDQLERMPGTLTQSLLEIMSALDYGYSITEKVFEIVPDGEFANLVGLKKLQTVSPHGVELVINEFGELERVTQESLTKSGSVDLPKDKLVVWSHQKEFGNWYGRSDLEAAYRAWWAKNNVYKWLQMFLERFGIPPLFFTYNADKYIESEIEELKTLIKGIQAATMGVIPMRGEDSLDLLTPENRQQVAAAFEPAINMYNNDISRSLLMPGLLGMTSDASEGSFARSKVHFDAFMLVIDYLGQDLEETVVNEQIIRPLVDINFNTDGVYPVWRRLPASDDTRLDIYETWANLVSAKIVKRQAADERHIRSALEFPEREIDDDEEYLDPEPPPSDQPPPMPPMPDDEGDETDDDEEDMAQRERTTHEERVDFQAIEAALDESEADASEAMVAILTAEKDRIVKAVEGGKLSPTSDVLNQREVRRLGRVLRAEMLDTFERGRGDFRAEVRGAEFETPSAVRPRSAERYLSNKAFWVTGVVSQALESQVQSLLVEALRNGESQKKTADKIEAAFAPHIGRPGIIDDERVTSPHRLETIIRTNINDSYNQGRLVELRDPEIARFVQGVQYSAILDTRTTDICTHLDMKVFRPGDPDLDTLTPPNHYNCRSIIVPIILDEDIRDADLITAEGKGTAADLIPPNFGGSPTGDRR